MRWLELHVVAPESAHEAIAQLCSEAGSPGVRFEPQRVIAYLPLTSEVHERKRWLFERLSHLPEWELPAVQAVETYEVDDSEWAEAWKSYFHAQRVSRRVVVKPTWEPYVAGLNEVVVELDPSMAFGTGQHASTQLCLEFLEELVQGGMTVVDVGTGSGILAIAAAKLGASFVWAGDNDPVAVLTAQRNVARNGVENGVRVHLAEGCEGAPACDLLVANLTAEVIEGLLADFTRCVKQGGWLVVSGIVTERSRRVREALCRWLWRQVQSRERGEWCAFAARRE